MGQNIGTCVTALISSVGTNKNARRAAMVHLYFNLIGTVVFLTLFTVLDSLFNFAFLDWPSNHFFIAVAHSLFNICVRLCFFPLADFLKSWHTRL
nr:Na/Pi symporter [Acetivibrio thermocellus]